MKASIFCLILFQIATLQAQDNVLDLNAENLTLLALKSSSPDVLEAYVSKLLKSKYTKEYFKALKNKALMKELNQRVKQDLELSLSGISEKQMFRLSKMVKYTPSKQTSESIQVDKLFPQLVYPVYRSYDQEEGLPDYFNLLMSNLQLLNDIKIEPELFLELVNSKQKTVFVETNLMISKYQNQQDFQVLIESIHLYKGKNKKQLIATKSTSKKLKKNFDNWMLSDGFSTKLVGIHSFSVLGYRLQDRINKTLILNNICEESNIINNHKVLTCIHSFTENSQIILIYIGGILAQLDLIINNQLNTIERNTLIKNLSMDLKAPRDFFSGEYKYWGKYASDFHLYPEVFSFNEGNKSNISGKNKLVFSMASHATTAIFEGK